MQDARFAIDGELTVDAFNREMHSHLSGWHAHTVAGLVLNAHGELPPVGTTVELDNIKFVVDAVDHNRIRRLIVTLPKADAPAAADTFSPEETVEGESEAEESFAGLSPSEGGQQSGIDGSQVQDEEK